MTPEAQRIAIAEACGWKLTDQGWYNIDCPIFRHDIPDYLNDLNAMHEAEKVLTKKQWMKYTDRILDQSSEDEYVTEYQVCAHATAAQRAEAFLRTLGLWKD